MEKQPSKKEGNVNFPNSLAYMPVDLAFMLLIKISMVHIAEVLTYRTPNIETYNMKEMSEILYNIGESIKIGKHVSSDETIAILQEMTNQVNKSDTINDLIALCCKKR
jgi:hypothetical protein